MPASLSDILRKTLATMDRAEALSREHEQAMSELRRSIALTIGELEVTKSLRRSETIPSNLIQFHSPQAAGAAPHQATDEDSQFKNPA